MQIISNNRARPLLSGYELPASARAAFDYMSDEQFECASFVRYKGHFYDLGEFMNIRGSTDLPGWHGYSNDTYFSGVLVKFCPDDNDRVIMGRYYS